MEPRGEGDLSTFFLPPVRIIYFAFFVNIFFCLFQLFWHEQHIFFSNVP
jgi:hypothetical protein